MPLLLAILAGTMLGVGVYTFGYASGASYLSNDPQACANCHVMQEQLEGWRKSSHGKVAVCNDCHTPPGFVPKYVTKAVNGFFHSWAFTTGFFPEQIRITTRNFKVTESSCLKCHADVAGAISAVSCISCHRTVGHL